MSNKKKNNTKSNGERSLYIAATVVLIVAAIIAALMLILGAKGTTDDMNVGIDGVDIYYGEPIGDAISRLGEPDSVAERDEYSGEQTYSYTVDAFGLKDVSLSITAKKDDHYDDQVYKVSLSMFADDLEDLFNRTRDHIRELYKGREGYYASDVSNYEGLYFCSVYCEAEKFTESCEISRDSEAVDLVAIYSPKY